MKPTIPEGKAVCSLCVHSVEGLTRWHYFCSEGIEKEFNYVTGEWIYPSPMLPEDAKSYRREDMFDKCEVRNKGGNCKDFEPIPSEEPEKQVIGLKDYDQIHLKCGECGVEIIVIQKKPE